MEKYSPLLGSHISLNRGGQYLLGVVHESISNGANTFMIFTGPPQNKSRVPVKDMFLVEARTLAEGNGISFSNCVVHAPYILNLANPLPENEEFNIDFLVSEVRRTSEMGIPYLVLHPGFHTGQTLDEGIDRLIRNLRVVLGRVEGYGVFICLETMAGKSNQIGKNLGELARIIGGCDNHPLLALCLDTVHLHDAGYDISRRFEFLAELDSLIGISRVKVIHLGDSMNPRGSGKDRHANLNHGHIGFDTLLGWAYEPAFRGLPIIVETPYWIHEVPGRRRKLISPYRFEIQLIRDRMWSRMPYNKYRLIYDRLANM